MNRLIGQVYVVAHLLKTEFRDQIAVGYGAIDDKMTGQDHVVGVCVPYCVAQEAIKECEHECLAVVSPYVVHNLPFMGIFYGTVWDFGQ